MATRINDSTMPIRLSFLKDLNPFIPKKTPMSPIIKAAIL